MDDRLAAVDLGGTVRWFHTDHQGSVVATTNGTGVITGRYVYSPYGELTRVGTSPVPLFAYTGRQYDPETGLYQYRARYYHPRLGVFLSTDPVGTKDDPNLYLYVGLDPVNATDPTGMDGIDLFFNAKQSDSDRALFAGGRALARSNSRVYFVSGHGYLGYVFDNRNTTQWGTGNSPSASLLSATVNKAENYDTGQILFLMACSSGIGSYASDLAQVRNQPVWAPVGFVETIDLGDGAFRFTVATALGNAANADSYWRLVDADGNEVPGQRINQVDVDRDGNVTYKFQKDLLPR